MANKIKSNSIPPKTSLQSKVNIPKMVETSATENYLNSLPVDKSRCNSWNSFSKIKINNIQRTETKNKTLTYYASKLPQLPRKTSLSYF